MLTLPYFVNFQNYPRKYVTIYVFILKILVYEDKKHALLTPKRSSNPKDSSPPQRDPFGAGRGGLALDWHGKVKCLLMKEKYAVSLVKYRLFLLKCTVFFSEYLFFLSEYAFFFLEYGLFLSKCAVFLSKYGLFLSEYAFFSRSTDFFCQSMLFFSCPEGIPLGKYGFFLAKSIIFYGSMLFFLCQGHPFGKVSTFLLKYATSPVKHGLSL